MQPLEPTRRYAGLDAVRATAMLLGVYYHALLFGMMFGGMPGGGPPGRGPGGPGGGLSGAMLLQDWLHSFRMPLFFLVSGFFCRMMLEKYGLWSYLRRRWTRLGVALIVGVFTFVPLYQLASAAFRGGPVGFGGGPGGGFPRGGAPFGGPGTMGDFPKPPAGVVPPPFVRFDANKDGTLDDAEWEAVLKDLRERGPFGAGGFGPPGMGGGGPQGDRQGRPDGPVGGNDRSRPPAGEVPPRFERFDTNQDGTLDDAEWDAVRRERRERDAGGVGPNGPGGGPQGGRGRGGFGPGGPGERPRPPAGVVPPRLKEFDANEDGTLDDTEWEAVQKDLRERGPAGFGRGGSGDFGPGGFGPPGDRPADGPNAGNGPAPAQPGDAASPPASSTPGGPPSGFGGPGGPPGPAGPVGFGGRPGGPRGGFGGMFSPPGEVSTWLFGESLRYFTLSHLWFLWYLLVFLTAGPLVAWLAAQAIARPAAKWIGPVEGLALRWQLVPLVVGLLSIPLLLMASGPFGWSLGLAKGIGRGFPDFAWHLETDMPFYFAGFMAGWWLHRQRDGLPIVASAWWINLLIGVGMWAGAAALSRAYAFRPDAAHYATLRLVGFSLYAISSAYTCWGFLGAFQKFADRPSVVWKYLADTAFWVYLLHQALLMPFLAWLAPLGLPWWANAGAASLLTTAAACLLYESLVRPTCLVRLFGPGPGSRESGKQADSASSPLPEPPTPVVGETQWASA